MQHVCLDERNLKVMERFVCAQNSMVNTDVANISESNLLNFKIVSY